MTGHRQLAAIMFTDLSTEVPSGTQVVKYVVLRPVKANDYV